MSSISSQAPVLGALMQLKLVESVISAIRAADQAASRASEPLIGSTSGSPRAQFQPTPKIAPRQILHPTPWIEPRQVIQLPPRVEATKEQLAPLPYSATPHTTAPTFQPPWKMLPWPNHVAPMTHFKRVHPHPDILTKGLLIDIFV